MAIDTVWVMVTAFLVMWMQAGFALVETGLTRAKNAVNICMKNLLDFSFGSIAFLVIGFGLMFGGPSDSSVSALSEYIGLDGIWFLSGEDNSPATGDDYVGVYGPINWTGVPLHAKFFFQMVFAATAATIVSGAMAERTRFASYMVYSVFITALIYPISGHWIWGGGWLADMGFWDFAGSTVVHSVGGWLALVGAFVLGPRKGKFDADGNPRAIPGHNLVLVTLGVFILWLGWFGFNPGSTMGTADTNLIALITVNTNTAAAIAAVAALFTAKLMFGKWEATMALNGALAGLVAITCPCAWVSVESSLIIGAIAGVLVVLSVIGIERFLRIDDPVGAISVHGVCGAWGTLALGLFSNGSGDASPTPGLFNGGGSEQLINQAIGVASVFGWCIVTGAICFYGIKAVMGLRVSEVEEAEGLDFGEHGNEAYHGLQFVDH
ncbi:MAG: ammonium transporter [Pirellulales bacterium]